MQQLPSLRTGDGMMMVIAVELSVLSLAPNPQVAFPFLRSSVLCYDSM